MNVIFQIDLFTVFIKIKSNWPYGCSKIDLKRDFFFKSYYNNPNNNFPKKKVPICENIRSESKDNFLTPGVVFA